MFNAKAFQAGKSAFAELKHCRNFLFIAFIIVLGQIIITTFGGEMFRVIPLNFTTWSIIIVATSLVLWGGELLRLIKK